VSKQQQLSVIVPCYNEEAVLAETHRRLSDVLERIDGIGYEVVYVDDGSRDGTARILADLQADDHHVRVVRFSRNFGHQTAVTAGLEHAKGDAVVLIDADLQDPPEVIPEFVARWREGYHVAYGVRTRRMGETQFKLATARSFYRLLGRFSETDIPSPDGDTMVVQNIVCVWMASRKSPISERLFTTLCARKRPCLSSRGATMSRKRL